VAALGALYSKASSPKASPGLYSLNNVGSVCPFYKKSDEFNLTKILVQASYPYSTTYKLSPSSPSLMITSPGFFFTYCIASSTIFNSSGLRAENMKACSNLFFKAYLTSGVFSCTGGLKSSFLLYKPNASALTDDLCFSYFPPATGSGRSSI